METADRNVQEHTSELSHRTSRFLLTTARRRCMNGASIGWSRYVGTEAGMLNGPHFSTTLLFSHALCLRAEL